MIIRENGEIVEITNSKNDLHNTFSPKNHQPVYRPGYKQKYINQMKTNRGLLFALGILILLFLAVLVGSDIRTKSHQTEINRLNNELERSVNIGEGMIQEYNNLLTEYASCSAKLPKPKVSTGKVSYYSHDGCIGCSPNQTMANGQPFDENAMTLAHNGIPLNTMVEVKNLDNNKTILAKVTDRGGFNRYSRVADLSKGLYLALGAKTDKSLIQFTWY